MNHKRLNLKLLAALIIGSGVFVVLVHLLHGYQVARNAEGLEKRADLAKDRGDLKDALRLRTRYLRHRSSDEEEWRKLQTDYIEYFMEEAGDGNVTPQLYQETRQIIEAVIRQLPEDQEVRLRAADFYAELGLASDALRHYQLAIRDSRQAGQKLELSPERTVKLAYALLSQGNEAYKSRVGVPGFDPPASDSELPSAEALLIDLVGFDPNESKFDPEKARAPDTLRAYNLLGQIYLARDNSNTALADLVIDGMVEANADNALAYLHRARFWQLIRIDKERVEKIRADIAKAEQLDPDLEEVLIARVKLAFSEQDYDSAEKLLENGLKLYPENAQIYSWLAKIYINKGDITKARNCIIQGLNVSKLKKNQMLLIDRANLQLAQSELKDYAHTYNELKQIGAPQERLDLLEAKEAYLKEDFRKCVSILERIRPSLDQITIREANIVLERCYAVLNMNDKRQNLLREMTEQGGATVDTLVKRADATAKSGRLDDAIDELRLVVTRLEGVEGVKPTDLARLRRQLLMLEIQKQSNRPEVERDWVAVDELMKVVLADENLPDAKKAAIKMQVLLDQGRTKEAEFLARQAQDKFPTEMAFWLARLRLSTTQTETFEILNQMREAVGDSVEYRLIRGDYIARNQGTLEELAQLAQDTDKFSPEEQYRLIVGIGKLYYQLGAIKDARELWEELARQRPQDATVQIMLFDLAQAAENDSLMEKQVNTLRRIAGPESDEYRIARATHLAWRVKTGVADPKDLEEARQLVRAIQNRRGNWTTVYQLAAELDVLDGKRSAAIENLQRAYELEPNNPSVVRRLATLLSQEGQFGQAEELLEQAGLVGRESLSVDQQIRIFESVGDFEGALQAAESYSKSNNPRELAIYGRLLTNAGKLSEAEQTLRSAIQLAPELPEPWLSLLDIALKKNDPLVIDGILKEGQLRIPTWQLPEFLGTAYRKMNDLTEAAKAFEMALRANPNSPSALKSAAELAFAQKDKARAESLLQRVLDSPDSGGEDRREARQQLARIWTSIDSGHPFSDVIQLMKKNGLERDEDDESARDAAGEAAAALAANSASEAQQVASLLSGEDLFLFVNLCASRPEYGYREMAVETLNRRRESGRLTDNEQFLLASLYKNMNRWKFCRELMHELLVRESARANRQIMSSWVEWLIEARDDRELRTWESSLAKGSNAAIRAQTYLMVRGGKSKEAGRVLSGIMPPEITSEHLAQVLTVTRWMESLAEIDPLFWKAAEQTLQRCVRVDADTWVDLARVMAKQQDPAKLDTILQMCQQAAARNRPEALEVAVDALRSYRSQLEQIQPQLDRVRNLLESAAPSSSALLQQAYFADITGDMVRLESLYREYLRQTDVSQLRQAVAQNNLAFLLALKDRAEEAFQLLEQAGKTFGLSPELLDTRAVIHLAQGDAEAAIVDLEDAITKGGESSEKLFHRAQAYLAQDDQQRARQDLQRSIELGLKAHELNPIEQQTLARLQSQLDVQPAPTP